MPKLDLRKELARYYTAKTSPEIVDVPSGNFLTVTGRGEPGGETYVQTLDALYALSYALKFESKKQGRDFAVMMLESLWWWDDPTIVDLQSAPPREQWNFKSMIRQPDFITSPMIEKVRNQVAEKKGPGVARVNFEEFHEGLSAQIMHIGPYGEEGPTITTLHRFVEEKGFKLRGHHHEIYLSDPRRTGPAKLKTIIRHPIEKT